MLLHLSRSPLCSLVALCLPLHATKHDWWYGNARCVTWCADGAYGLPLQTHFHVVLLAWLILGTCTSDQVPEMIESLNGDCFVHTVYHVYIR